jgi:hypothetical protein
MLRFLFTFLFTFLSLLAVAGFAAAQQSTTKAPPSESDARKARVAAALAGACGTCRSDLDEAKAESLKTGRPIVLFVGGCDGRAKEFRPEAAIYVAVAEYKPDEKTGKRIVVLGPKSDGSGFLIWATLPPDAPVEKVREFKVKATLNSVKPKAVALDWDLGAPSKNDPADDAEDAGEPIAITLPTLAQDCPGGRCAVPTSTMVTTTASPPGTVRATDTGDDSPGVAQVVRDRRTPIRTLIAGTVGQTVIRVGVGLEHTGIALQYFGRLIPFSPARRAARACQ